MELDLKKTVSILLNKWWIIVGVAIFGLCAFFLVSTFLITPKYTSQATLYVTNMSERKSSIVTSSDVLVSKELVSTCIVILNSRIVLDKVAEESGLNYSAAQIKNMLSAEAVSSTEIFKVQITHTDPREAQIIADTVIKVAPSEIKRVMNAGAVSIIDYATLPLAPSSPNIPRNTVFGGMIGAILAAFAIILIDKFDTRIKSEFDLVGEFEIPIIGIVPSFRLAGKTNVKRQRVKR